VLYDAMWNPHFIHKLVQAIVYRRQLRGRRGILRGTCTAALRHVKSAALHASTLLSPPREESNTTVVCGDWGVFKLFRRADVGTHPEFEIGHVLTTRGFAHTPPVVGALEHHQRHRPAMALALVQRFVPHKHDAWEYTLARLRRDLRRPRLSAVQVPAMSLTVPALLDGVAQEPPLLARQRFAPMLKPAQCLGQRTAELHLILAAETEDPAFAPEPLTALHQRPLYQRLRNLTLPVFQTLRRHLPRLAGAARHEASQVLAREGEVLVTFRALLQRPLTVKRIRCHGNYHLKQVLCTRTDVAIVDFEGEPARPLFERRLKRLALEDVAGMLRSFHYAAQIAAAGAVSPTRTGWEDGASVDAWIRFWQYWVSAAFLRAYSAGAAQGTWLPETPAELRALLNASMLARTVYELGYELNYRPDWVRIPLQGILQLLGHGAAPPPEDQEGI
jgi:maltose alpha-D-glucosyltransferase / alpha-amylase